LQSCMKRSIRENLKQWEFWTMVNPLNSYIYLSHPLHANAPAYGGGNAFKTEQDKRISHGDSCNTSKWSLSSHAGTHLDFPRHFSTAGRVLDDYDPSFFVLENIHVVDVSPVQPGQIITSDDLDISDVPADTELLLIKTGFSKYRAQPVYWQRNPGFHPDLAGQFRKQFPLLRIIGFDSISLSSFTNRELGREAHKAFLDNARPILPLEDMNLEKIDNQSKIRRMVAVPLHVQGADGSPCMVLALID